MKMMDTAGGAMMMINIKATIFSRWRGLVIGGGFS